MAMTAQSANSEVALRSHYFLVVWAYQGRDDDLVHAHTFTSFYKGDDLAKGVVHPLTLSWLPASGVVQLFGVEKGRNFSLAQTMGMACRAGRDVKSWGPYEIRPELYHRAMKRLQLLQSGRVKYAMTNGSPHSMNCIRAAGDITPEPLDTGILWGNAASAQVVRHLSPYFVGDGTPIKGLAAIARGCARHGGEFASSVPH
jgi:hypothetical protein